MTRAWRGSNSPTRSRARSRSRSRARVQSRSKEKSRTRAEYRTREGASIFTLASWPQSQSSPEPRAPPLRLAVVSEQESLTRFKLKWPRQKRKEGVASPRAEGEEEEGPQARQKDKKGKHQSSGSKEKKHEKKQRKRSQKKSRRGDEEDESFSSSASDSDTTRSAISGKKIKRKLNRSAADIQNQRSRHQLLQFYNGVFD